MNSVLVLLSPLWLSWRNGYLRTTQPWTRRFFLLPLSVAFWAATFVVVRRVLLYFQSVPELGPALAYQFLLIILLTFFSMLLFSNLISALSTFFLAHDLELILATPTSADTFYYARLIATMVNSSWMVLFFSLPIFAAYAAVFNGPATFYLWVALLFPLFLVIPAAVGVLVTHLLVCFLPARRIREILFFLGLFVFISLYFLFRFARPEQLVQPENFGHFMQFLSAMQTPSSPFLPSSWIAEILAGSLFSRPTDPVFFLALLASYALFFPLVTSWVSGAVYFSGWSKTQESRHGRRKLEFVERLLRSIIRPFPEAFHAIMLKDIKTFLRDATQWSQLFLLAALIVVYLYNFNVLPLDRSPIGAGPLKTLVSFANLGLAGFVLSAIAIRFAFPAVSLEGKAFWLLQTLPVPLRSVLWSKFWLNFLPLLLLGELLVFLSNLLLRVPSWMMVLSLITVWLMAFGITAISVSIGALYPKFNFANPAEIATSFGGALCMIFSVTFIAFVVMIEAWPIYQLAIRSLNSGQLKAPDFWVIAPSVIAVVLLTIVAAVVPLKLGFASLERLKD